MLLGCSHGWKEFNNSCYKYNTYKSSWHDAVGSCFALSSSLASIHSREEEGFIYYLSGANDDEIWIGGEWMGNGYYWIDYSNWDYTNWTSNEPNRSGDCVYTKPYSGWDDYDCSAESLSVCKQSTFR